MADIVRTFNELVRPEFDRFTASARAIVEERSQELLDNYITRQAETAREYFGALEQPHMQRALQSAQIEYATNGDEDLGRMLVDLLVDLSKQSNRSMYAMALQEAIQVVSKLTNQQMNALTVLDQLRMKVFGWATPADLHSSIRSLVVPFASDLPQSALNYRHIVGNNAGWLSQGHSDSFPEYLRDKYPGLFTYGIDEGRIPRETLDIPGLWIPAHRNPEKLQIFLMSENHLSQVLKQNIANLSSANIAILKNLHKTNLMSPKAVGEELVSENPEMGYLIQHWEDNPMSNLELSTTGIVIAEANLRFNVPDAPHTAWPDESVLASINVAQNRI